MPDFQPAPNPSHRGNSLGSAALPRRLHEQLPFITTLILLEPDSQQVGGLFQAFISAAPAPRLLRGVASAVLQSPVPAARLAAAQALLNDTLGKDLVPLVFAAYSNERHSGTREKLRALLQETDGRQLYELETYFEALRYTPQAEAADLKVFDDQQGMSQSQLRRAQVILLLDPDPDLRRMAASCLYSAVRPLAPESREALLCSVNYGLREPVAVYEPPKGEILYLAEKLWSYLGPADFRNHGLLIIRPLYQSQEAKVAADAAVVSLTLKPEGRDELEVLTRFLADRQALATKLERPQLAVAEIHDLEREVEAMRRYIQTLLGPDADTSALDRLKKKYQRGQEQLIEKFEELLERRFELFEKRQQRLDDWGREILVSRVASRIDGVSRELRGQLVDALFGVLDGAEEPLRVRKSILHNLSLNLEDNSRFLEKFITIAADATQPEELRCWACRSIPRLEKISGPELDRAIVTLSHLKNFVQEPLVQNEAELSVRKLKIFKAKPQLRFALLFDVNGNLRPDAKEILRDVVNPDYDM